MFYSTCLVSEEIWVGDPSIVFSLLVNAGNMVFNQNFSVWFSVKQVAFLAEGYGNKASSECQLPLCLGLPAFFGTTVQAHTRPSDSFSSFPLASMLATSPYLALSMVSNSWVLPLLGEVSLYRIWFPWLVWDLSLGWMGRRKYMIL